jgi:5-oxoprolinase (ATP-hydrolysing)
MGETRESSDQAMISGFPKAARGPSGLRRAFELPMLHRHRRAAAGQLQRAHGRDHGGGAGREGTSVVQTPMGNSRLTDPEGPAFGGDGGEPGAPGVNRVERADGTVEVLGRIGSAGMEFLPSAPMPRWGSAC